MSAKHWSKLAKLIAAVCTLLAILLTVEVVQPSVSNISEDHELIKIMFIKMNGRRSERILMPIDQRAALEQAGKTIEFMRGVENDYEKALLYLIYIEQISLKYNSALLAFLVVMAAALGATACAIDLAPDNSSPHTVVITRAVRRPQSSG